MMKFLLLFLFIFFLKDFWFFMVFLFYLFLFLFFYFPSNYNFIYFFFYLDNLSYLLILLSLWILGLMILASEGLYFFNYYLILFILNMFFLLLFLVLAFLINNLFMFYFFFESSLIPILILILGWGYQPERIQAGLYLLFYTLFASLPLLIGLFFVYSYLGSLNFFFLSILNFKILYFSLLMAFLVKMPMFLVHLWLPKAHVEAPISGSMILAGVLLKLGGYGIIRVYKLLLMINTLNLIWISISIIGGVLMSLNCLRQIDMKMLIAYSSVAHMALVLGSLLTLGNWGVNGCYYMMIAHGLCSSGMFCLANVSYERLKSRSLMINKGLISFMPSLSLWWFLLCSSNMSAPPSLNLVSEIMMINSLLSWSFILMVFLFFIIFFSISYSLYLFSYSQFGNVNLNLFSFSSGNLREYILMFLHWFPLNFLILKLNLFLI